MIGMITVLAYMRIALYPLCGLGMILLALMEQYPQERRGLHRYQHALYIGQGIMFLALGLAALLRLNLETHAPVIDYLLTPPLVLTAIAIGVNIWYAARQI